MSGKSRIYAMKMIEIVAPSYGVRFNIRMTLLFFIHVFGFSEFGWGRNTPDGSYASSEKPKTLKHSPPREQCEWNKKVEYFWTLNDRQNIQTDYPKNIQAAESNDDVTFRLLIIGLPVSGRNRFSSL